ncbi:MULTISPECIES: molybdopterin converting factor subunit 1 [Methylomicrobium]|uniref:Molybdopterin synthase sulfur carrier subunit n=1 Tax=Methylomicrobium album BG8 TaxID=686340 RepID=H8GFX8_METAL|nr:MULTISPECIES: molybdopterin converting factor subunit 1 [Methylomicrobium]EIC28729.1 molybdopterin converting factor, subunit 1 [Methylomicrobium album BG8]
MSIKVRYFASLKERIGRAEEDAAIAEPVTAKALWRQCVPELPPPEQILVAINLEYADWDSLVRDGDEVAFFPPVTGG